MVGRGEFILDQTSNIPADNTSYQDSGYASTAATGGNGLPRGHEMITSNGNNYSPDPLLHLQRPNSIEVNRAYEQQVQQQQMQQRMASVNLNTNGSTSYQQEPIYTPHVLRGNSGDEPPSHRYNPQPITSQQNHYPPTAMFGRTQENNMDGQQPFSSHPFLEATPATTAAAAQQQHLNQQPQLQQFNPGYQYQQQSQNQSYQQNQSPVGTPSKSNGGQRRPSQPPPAPPPGGALSPTPSAGTPTRNGAAGSRANSTQRDSLPPPPPPPGTTSTPITGNTTTLSETQQQLHHNLMNGLQHQFTNASNSPPKQINMGGPIHSSNQQNNSNHNINNVSNSMANHSVSSTTHDDSLPPPPPVPDAAGLANSANNSLNVKMNHLEHLLPPSPPPPPAPSSSVPTTSSSIIPPPPPPPPADLNSNGPSLNAANLARSGKLNGDIKSDANSTTITGVGSPQRNTILSPPGLRKPVQPNHLKAQDGERSDLLKAIRDGKFYVGYNGIYF